MDNFGVLYRYECKKLLSRKIVWISFSLCIITIVASLFAPFLGSYYAEGEFIDTNYRMQQIDKRYSEALSGREINQELLEETIAAYRKIPDVAGMNYTMTEEYQQYARPYSEIFNFIRRTTGMQTSEVIRSWQPDENDLYAKRQIWLTSSWKDLGLSKGEMDFWREREEQIKTPYVYQEYRVYDIMISSYQTVGFFVWMLLAICLSGIFSDEHTRKTDQIILSSPLGKKKLYWAKIVTGVSFAAISTILLFTFLFVIAICLYGMEGFQAAFQFIYTDNSDNITCGQAVMIAYGNMIIAAVITSVFVMVLSELLRSNIAAVAISTGLLILNMIVMIPAQYRVLAQIWAWLPWCFLTPWNVFSNYTISIFGHYLTSWQAVPMIYMITSVMLAVIGKPIYQRFQVSGR
ncbi:MAG: ABC transporter permease [Eubacterium sp.]|nr:ABC transporter permease [Eubacterium sp.]